MGCNGTNQTQLTDNSADDKQPSWASNGKLAYSSNLNSDGGYDIYLLTLDPWDISRLTTNAADDEAPALSPDGTKVAYVSYRDTDGDAEVYVLTVSDRSVVPVTDNTFADKEPAWSPDGSKLAFASDRDGDWDIYVADADGSNVDNLTDSATDDSNGYDERYPDWGEDVYGDGYIAFTTDRDGYTKIYMMDDDGGNPEQASSRDTGDGEPSWGPASEYMVFQRTSQDGQENVEVFTMGYVGDEQTNISVKSSASDSSPDWEPPASDSDVYYCGGGEVPTS